MKGVFVRKMLWGIVMSELVILFLSLVRSCMGLRKRF